MSSMGPDGLNLDALADDVTTAMAHGYEIIVTMRDGSHRRGIVTQRYTPGNLGIKADPHLRFCLDGDVAQPLSIADVSAIERAPAGEPRVI